MSNNSNVGLQSFFSHFASIFHPSIYSFIHFSFIHPFIYLFIYSFIHSSIFHPSIHPSIHSSIFHSSIYSSLSDHVHLVPASASCLFLNSQLSIKMHSLLNPFPTHDIPVRSGTGGTHSLLYCLSSLGSCFFSLQGWNDLLSCWCQRSKQEDRQRYPLLE